jgi:porphobilinogen synthase
MTDLITRPRRLRQSAALRAMFEETTLSLNDLVLPIFVEEEIDDYKAIEAMPGVMRIPEKYLAREIERIANAGIRSVMTFGISHHTDATGSDTWNENGLVARMSRICKVHGAGDDRHVRYLLLRIHLPRPLRRAVRPRRG